MLAAFLDLCPAFGTFVDLHLTNVGGRRDTQEYIQKEKVLYIIWILTILTGVENIFKEFSMFLRLLFADEGKLTVLKSYNSISQTIVVPKSQRDFHILTQLLDLSLVELFSILFHSPHIHSYESSLCSPLIVTCFWKIFRYRKCYVETCRTQWKG